MGFFVLGSAASVSRPTLSSPLPTSPSRHWLMLLGDVGLPQRQNTDSQNLSLWNEKSHWLMGSLRDAEVFSARNNLILVRGGGYKSDGRHNTQLYFFIVWQFHLGFGWNFLLQISPVSSPSLLSYVLIPTQMVQLMSPICRSLEKNRLTTVPNDVFHSLVNLQDL